MSPPNLPTPAYFVPLGALIDYVRAGNRFTAVCVDDIRSGEWQVRVQTSIRTLGRHAEQCMRVKRLKNNTGKATMWGST